MPVSGAFPVGPNSIQELGTALGDFQQTDAARKAKIATDKATAATAGPDAQARIAADQAAPKLAALSLEEKQADLRNEQLKADTSTLGRIVPMLSQNPALGKSPALLQAVSPIFQRLGIPTPVLPDGSLDVPALQAFTTAPMSPAAIEKIVGSVDATVKEFENPKTNMTPEQFGKAIKAKYDLLMRTGNVPEAESLLAYITPDGKPTPEYADRVMSGYVQTEMNHLDAMNIGIQDREALQQAMLAERKRQFDANFGEKKREFGVKMTLEQQRIQNQANATAQRLAFAQEHLRIAEQNLDLAKDRFQRTGSLDDLRVEQAVISQTRSQLSAWRTQLNSITNTLRQMSATDKASAQGQALITQAGQLNDLITQNEAKFNAESAAAQQGLGTALSNITGNATKVLPDAKPKTAVNPADGATYYLWPDGKYHSTPP
jgi:hypothetical protein